VDLQAVWTLLVRTIYKTRKRLSHTAVRKFLLKFPAHSLVLVPRFLFEEFKRGKRTQIHQNMKIQLSIKFNNVHYKSAHRYCCSYAAKQKETTKVDLLTEHTFRRAPCNWSWHTNTPHSVLHFLTSFIKTLNSCYYYSSDTCFESRLGANSLDWRFRDFIISFQKFLVLVKRISFLPFSSIRHLWRDVPVDVRRRMR
jgi:hypothetical protein